MEKIPLKQENCIMLIQPRKKYLKWSQLIKTILKGKGSISHLIDDALVEDDPKFKSQDEEDSMIMAWLWNPMVTKISDTCMFLK